MRYSAVSRGLLKSVGRSLHVVRGMRMTRATRFILLSSFLFVNALTTPLPGFGLSVLCLWITYRECASAWREGRTIDKVISTVGLTLACVEVVCLSIQGIAFVAGATQTVAFCSVLGTCKLLPFHVCRTRLELTRARPRCRWHHLCYRRDRDNMVLPRRSAGRDGEKVWGEV